MNRRSFAKLLPWLPGAAKVAALAPAAPVAAAAGSFEANGITINWAAVQSSEIRVGFMPKAVVFSTGKDFDALLEIAERLARTTPPQPLTGSGAWVLTHDANTLPPVRPC